MGRDNTIYRETVRVTEEYLGPAGERFIRRQISTHLNIEPEKLDTKNLNKLIVWLSMAFALITNNSRDIDSFTKDLKSLTANSE